MPVEYTQITELTNDYLMCRTIGHAWDENPNGEVNSDLFKSSLGVLMLRCTRCTCERFDYLDNSLAVWNRYYRYPSHYQTIPGEATRPVLRGEMLARSFLIQSRDKRRGRRTA